MPRDEVIVTIKGGKATVETRGFKGRACLVETADLEKALGKTTESKATREMHEDKQKLRQRQ